MTEKIVVLSTCGSEEEAARIARQLVEGRIAACVNLMPRIRSFYRWQGKVEDSAEWMLLIKTSRARFEALRTVLEAAHSYELPEVLALAVVDGSPNYLAWLEGEIGTENEAELRTENEAEQRIENEAELRGEKEAEPGPPHG